MITLPELAGLACGILLFSIAIAVVLVGAVELGGWLFEMMFGGTDPEDDL